MSKRHWHIIGWENLRREALERADWRCEWIERGRLCRHRAGLEVDHKKPLHKGGTNKLDNLQVLCRKHHILKTRLERGLTPERAAMEAFRDKLKEEYRYERKAR